MLHFHKQIQTQILYFCLFENSGRLGCTDKKMCIQLLKDRCIQWHHFAPGVVTNDLLHRIVYSGVSVVPLHPGFAYGWARNWPVFNCPVRMGLWV